MSQINRSELLFVYDAQDCNPNGNPIGDNRPRRDPDTGHGIVTDVRLKRYLRDQLLQDGYDIYVKKVDGQSRTRTHLIKNILGGVEDASDIEDIKDVGKKFLNAATDVRYFGATLSFESKDTDEEEEFRAALNSSFPNHYQGPVQFLPAKSLNTVEENEEYDSLTSVISTGEENRQGGFDLDDKRIKYGIFPFYGLVDNNNAKATNLSQEDIERLDTLCWRALKNQTTSRSKLGQSPRLYLRVEYEQENYHIGGLHNLIQLSDDSRESLRSVRDVAVDVSELVDTLNQASERIKQLHIVGDDRLTVEVDEDVIKQDNSAMNEDTIGADSLAAVLESEGHDVHEIDVLAERDIASETE